MNEVAEMSDDGSDISRLTDEESIESDQESEDELGEETSKLNLDAKDSDESDSSDASESEAPPLVPSSAYGGTNYTTRTTRTSRTTGSRTSSMKPQDDLRTAVTSDLAKQRLRTESKHHARKGLNT